MDTHIPTLIAIAPLPLLFLIGLPLGGIFGLRALFKKRNQLPPAPNEGTGRMPAPLLTMQAGTTTGRLERVGTNWRWSFAGASTAASSDADAGKAAIAMAQTLAEVEPDAPIVGSAGGPNSATVDFGIEPEGDGWTYTLTTASKLPAPAPPQLLTTNVDPSRSAALLAVLAELAKHIDWLTYAGPPLDSVGQPPAPPTKYPGLLVTGDVLAVTDLPSWVAYAAPIVREALAANPMITADELMDIVIGDRPDTAMFNGKTLAATQATLEKALVSIRDGKYRFVAAPDEGLAALIVGDLFHPSGWKISTYKDHVILVRPGGRSVNLPKLRWQWLVWTGEMRGYDDDARASGLRPPGRTEAQALGYAKQQIDQDFPQPGDGESGGNQEFDASPDPVKPEIFQGVFGQLAPASVAYAPKVVTRTVSVGWTSSKVVEFEIFDFLDGKKARKVPGTETTFAQYSDWTIGVGVCITTDRALPFGTLSTELTKAKGFGMASCASCRIQNSSANNGQIGPPVPIDWTGFMKPLTWKGQFQGHVHRAAQLGITPLEDITGSSEGAVVDPCPSRELRWPEPSDPAAGFYVQPIGSIQYTAWKPTPIVTLTHKGTKLIARVELRGLPVFLRVGNADQASNSSTPFKLEVKVWAGGENA